MKILKPNIAVYWNQGITMKVHSFLYVDPTTPRRKYRGENADLSIHLYITGRDTPTVKLTCNQGYSWNEGQSDNLLKLIPGAMEAVNAWIDEHGLIAEWEQEVAIYNSVMGSIDLPGITLNEGEGGASYTLSIKPEGEYDLPTLEVMVSVREEGAMVELQLDSGETDDDWNKIMCSLCTYPLDLPITMDSLKASICRPFEQYLNTIRALKGQD